MDGKAAKMIKGFEYYTYEKRLKHFMRFIIVNLKGTYKISLDKVVKAFFFSSGSWGSPDERNQFTW